MDSDAPRRGGWLSIGAFLPTRVRERLFEPAYYDLLRASLVPDGNGRRAPGFGLRVLGVFGAAWCHGIAMLLRDRRFRRTLYGIGATLFFGTLALAFLLRGWLLVVLGY